MRYFSNDPYIFYWNRIGDNEYIDPRKWVTKSEDHIQKWFSNIGIVRSCFRKIIANKYIKLRFGVRNLILYLIQKIEKFVLNFMRNPKRRKLSWNSKRWSNS